MMKERLLERVDELIAMGNAVLKTRRRDTYDGGWDPFSGQTTRRTGPEHVDDGKMTEFRTASLSFIRQVYDEQHPHFKEFYRIGHIPDPETVESSLGILNAVRGEIEGDWLFTVKGLVTAEVFTDYLEMAEYLLESNYKDPAAVIAGSTLEEHLRQLCRKNGIAVTRKKDGKDVPVNADQLNIELTKATVYNALVQKQVTAWLGLRNHAAHGEYKEYNAEQVKGMIAGITEFMAR
ncbi:MAG: hypothetical protein JW993_18290 [Sedimentisphaerales bacterium]|nr:hypothetical protein [Sedimentisphaerales bacterium]